MYKRLAKRLTASCLKWGCEDVTIIWQRRGFYFTEEPFWILFVHRVEGFKKETDQRRLFWFLYIQTTVRMKNHRRHKIMNNLLEISSPHSDRSIFKNSHLNCSSGQCVTRLISTCRQEGRGGNYSRGLFGTKTGSSGCSLLNDGGMDACMDVSAYRIETRVLTYLEKRLTELLLSCRNVSDLAHSRIAEILGFDCGWFISKGRSMTWPFSVL